jgi:hypothetical protein
MNEAPCVKNHTLIIFGNLTGVRIAVVGTVLGHAHTLPGSSAAITTVASSRNNQMSPPSTERPSP